MVANKVSLIILILLYYYPNRKQKFCSNSKESPEWFQFFPEWKQAQLKEYFAINEESIQVLSKHKGWIPVSSKTNNRLIPLEKNSLDRENHRKILPKWMNLNYLKNYKKKEDTFKSFDSSHHLFNKKNKTTILLDKNYDSRSNKNPPTHRSIFSYQDFRNNVNFEEDRKIYDNMVSQEPKKFFDWDDKITFNAKSKKDT